jgi:HK97 family phage portal protein
VKQSWKENHSGRKSGGVAILEEGTKFNPTSMSPDVLQFLQSRQFNVLEIARFLGLPPTKLFDVTAATYSNQEQSNLEVATDTLDAWARALESEADVKLLNKQYGGRRSEMDLYAIFRGDMNTRANYFSKMMQVSSLSPNEIRMKEGLAPYEGGDRYFIAVNNYSPADRIDEIVDAQIAKGEPKETKDIEEKDDVEEKDDKALVQAAIKYLEGK